MSRGSVIGEVAGQKGEQSYPWVELHDRELPLDVPGYGALFMRVEADAGIWVTSGRFTHYHSPGLRSLDMEETISIGGKLYSVDARLVECNGSYRIRINERGRDDLVVLGRGRSFFGQRVLRSISKQERESFASAIEQAVSGWAAGAEDLLAEAREVAARKKLDRKIAVCEREIAACKRKIAAREQALSALQEQLAKLTSERSPRS